MGFDHGTSGRFTRLTRAALALLVKCVKFSPARPQLTRG